MLRNIREKDKCWLIKIKIIIKKNSARIKIECDLKEDKQETKNVLLTVFGK